MIVHRDNEQPRGREKRGDFVAGMADGELRQVSHGTNTHTAGVARQIESFKRKFLTITQMLTTCQMSRYYLLSTPGRACKGCPVCWGGGGGGGGDMGDR